MSISEQRANELFNILANDPAQSFKCDWWCGPRSSLMVGRLLEQGVSHDDIGQVMLWAPPAFLYESPAQQPLMSCSRSLKPDLLTGQEVIVGDYLLRGCTEGDQGWIEILNADGSPIAEPVGGASRTIRYAQGNDDHSSRWGNHIAATLKVDTRIGVEIFVADPRISDRLMTTQEWKDKQNCLQAIIMHAEMDGVLKLCPVDSESSALIATIARAKSIEDPYGKGQQDVIVAISGFEGKHRGQIANYYDPPMVKDAEGKPSLTNTVNYFAAFLKPLRTIQDWAERGANVQEQNLIWEAKTEDFRCMIEETTLLNNPDTKGAMATAPRPRPA